MLSILLFGRNDDHGYNYHKRLAISLNCLAELLSDNDDEIIFVDYNSSDELPTIVEAIQDTLTDKTKSLIKIFRVRPHHHARFKTHLSILEPVARNIALRRSNPNNKWVLSTNVDMIFVPQEKASLSEIAASLEDGYYCLPRFELPENLWELALKRLDPAWNISFLRENSSKLHLNTCVRKEGFLLFDNPGDFQLMPRKDIIEMGGFDEAMLKGWHVDSNLAKRMSLLGKKCGSLEKVLKGYHCNHTHKESVLHNKNRTSNDLNRFVNNNAINPIANGPDWGLVNEKIEEITFGCEQHLSGIAETLKSFPVRDYEVLHDLNLYNRWTYSTPRIFTYLADHLSNAPKSTNVVYIGHNSKLVKMLESYLEANQFTGKLFLEQQEASLYIFDFGFDEDSIGQKRDLKKVMKSFLKLMANKKKIDRAAKFIGININYTDFHVIFLKHLSMRLSSYITGSAYGYLPSGKNKGDSLKKKFVLNLRYFLIRYLFKYSDRVRSLVLRTKLSKIL